MCAEKSSGNDQVHKNDSKDEAGAASQESNVFVLNQNSVDDGGSTNAERGHKAKRISRIILEAFDKHYRIFLRITQEAKSRFVEADWLGEQAASRQRITLYTQRVTEATDKLHAEFSDLDNLDELLWKKVKQNYIALLYDHKQPELAETFYNSVFTWLFDRRYYNNSNIFVRPSTSTEYLSGDSPTYYSFYPRKEGTEIVVRSILDKFDIGLPFHDLEQDVKNLTEQLEARSSQSKRYHDSYQLQVISSLFYRNKATYIIGRIFNGLSYCPFVIPILNNEQGEVYVDAFVVEKKDINNLFSFARAYFMVDTEVPSAVVHFLQQMLPRKTAAEMYTSIGLQKQGKTEFYRDFLHHLTHSTDQLKISSGTKGMVMSVFTLPSYPFVFKVINDRFAPPKNVTRKIVKEKYQMVKMHDRVGRMADTLEFSYVSFPLSRFSEELLEELKKKISNSLEIEGDLVIIRHLYIERRLRPLNLYLEENSEKEKKVEHAIIGYCNAIKELAAANIFPGDLLTKNFGVTRYGRVIFYDYDEIELLTDCNFRKIPPPRTPEDEMASEPWYSVEPMDIFPEEWLPFLFTKLPFRKAFMKHHPDLLEPEYWQSVQENIEKGKHAHVYPYSQKIRFQNIYK